MEKKVCMVELANNLKQAAINHLYSVFGEYSVEYLCAKEYDSNERNIVIVVTAGGKEFEISVKKTTLLA